MAGRIRPPDAKALDALVLTAMATIRNMQTFLELGAVERETYRKMMERQVHNWLEQYQQTYKREGL